jgi:hypothetical protein
VLLLEVDSETSLNRRPDDPDPYEAGLDVGLSADVRQSYRLFQERLAGCLERYAAAAGFTRIDAAGPTEEVEPRVLAAADAVIASRGAR